MAENTGQIPNYDFNQNPGFVPPQPQQPQDQFNQNVAPVADYGTLGGYPQSQTNDFYQPQPQFQPQIQPQVDPLSPAPGQYPDISAPVQPAAYSDFNQNPYGSYPDEQAVATPANTFEQKRSGNRLFFIIAGVIVVILLGALGFLFYNNYQTTKNNATPASTTTDTTKTDNTNTQNTNQAATFNSALTGGPNSPATLARKQNATTMPADWILSKFTSADRDSSGKCLNDKVCGDQADNDNDNLSNLEEYNFGTDPLLADSDKDGLADGDEVYVYFTDPTKADSDNDSYKDGSEMANCYDPISTDSSKADKDRLAKITNSVALKKLKEPTITTLKAAGATTADLDKGYVDAKCSDTPATTSTTPATNNTTSTATPATSTTNSSSVGTSI